MKTQDPKILEQLQTLQKKMTEQMEKAVANSDKGVNKVSNPPNGIPGDTIRYWIVEERDGRVSRLIVTYPQPALQQTVIQMVWDLNDYQTAWRETTK